MITPAWNVIWIRYVAVSIQMFVGNVNLYCVENVVCSWHISYDDINNLDCSYHPGT